MWAFSRPIDRAVKMFRSICVILSLVLLGEIFPWLRAVFGFRIGRAHIFPWVSQKATKGCTPGINFYYGERITEEGERKPVLAFEICWCYQQKGLCENGQ